MQVTTYTDFRQQLKSYLDKVRNNHTPLICYQRQWRRCCCAFKS